MIFPLDVPQSEPPYPNFVWQETEPAKASDVQYIEERSKGLRHWAYNEECGEGLCRRAYIEECIMEMLVYGAAESQDPWHSALYCYGLTYPKPMAHGSEGGYSASTARELIHHGQRNILTTS